MHAEHPPTGDVDFAAGGGPKNGELTVNAIIAGVLVAVLMGATYPYMTLKLGFGPNVSVVAAFFGYMLLNGLAFVTRKPYDRWQNNIVQTAGTSAAQTAFMCVLLGAFDLLRAGGKVPFAIELTPTKAFVWLTVACTLGVLMAVPLRQHFIVDEKLTFADGVATAETLVVLDPPANASAALRDKARKAALALAHRRRSALRNRRDRRRRSWRARRLPCAHRVTWPLSAHTLAGLADWNRGGNYGHLLVGGDRSTTWRRQPVRIPAIQQRAPHRHSL